MGFEDNRPRRAYPSVYKAYKQGLMEEFHKLMDSSEELSNNICSIDLLRLGFDKDNPSNNPIVISTTVDWSIDPPVYLHVQKKIVERLREERFSEVEVEFERGEIWGGWSGFDWLIGE